MFYHCGFVVQLCLVLWPLSANTLNVTKLKVLNCTAFLNIPPPKSRNASLVDWNESSEISECPPWFHWDIQTGACQAGPQLGGIVQQNMKTLQTFLLECYCMTVDGDSLSVGACLYTCNALDGYFPLPCQVSKVNNYTCADLNRQGPLCGQCMEDYAPPVYSYELKCVECKEYRYNWLKYLAVAFIPLTIFFVLVTLFSISFTSPLLSGVVLMFQLVVSPVQMEVILSFLESGEMIITRSVLVLLSSMAGFWNLDFFRLAYHPFCLHPSLSTLQILSLDYAIAVYPLFLILLTYVMVKLHDRNFKPVVWAWKPFSCILRHFRRQWDVRTSLIDVFASFIFLSTSRLVLASFNFLVPTSIYTLPQNSSEYPTMKRYLLNAPTIEYFSLKHLPFALLAIVVLLLLDVLPMTLLFVYPFRWFQHLLNKLGLNCHTLRTFIEVFQGPFKDGTNGTKDYRHFSGFLLLLSLILPITFSQTVSSFYYPMASIFTLLYLTLLIVFQPYKKNAHNCIMIVMVTAFLWGYWGMIINIGVQGIVNKYELQIIHADSGSIRGIWLISIILMCVAFTIPTLYLLGLMCVLVSKIPLRKLKSLTLSVRK